MSDDSDLDAGISEAFLSSPLSSPTTAGSFNIAGVKRGRGRPPKNGICRVEPKKSGRGRGRPRKEVAASTQTKEAAPQISTPASTSKLTSVQPPEPAPRLVSETFPVQQEDQEDRVLENFQAMLLTIDFLKRKHSVSDFSSVRQGVEGITSRSFSENDLIDVLSVCSKNFQVEWKQIAFEEGQSPQNCLCVVFSSEVQSESAYNRPVSIIERTEDYKKHFVEWMEQGKPRSFQLPPEPVPSPSLNRRKQTEFAEKLRQAAEESKNVSPL